MNGKQKKRRSYVTKDIIKDVLIKANNDLKGNLTQIKYGKWASKHHEITYTTVLDHFDSWNDAKTYAGLSHNKIGRKSGNTYSDEELIGILKEAKMNIDGILSINKYEEWRKHHNKPSYVTISQRFKSWNNAKIIAGIE